VKAAPFAYMRPANLAEACAVLAADAEARPVAGGQTLIPMMAMRLARPTTLVDIARLSELDGLAEDGDDLVIGAAVRQAVAERSSLMRRLTPLLAAALPWVGHQPTRNRGTVGGSVANADPAAEIPLTLVTLGGCVEVVSTTGRARLAADAFFTGPMTTALEDGALVAGVRFPVWRERRIGVGFHEISARRSDFAYVSAAAQVALDEDGRCLRCAVGIGGATPFPTALAGAAAALQGRRPTPDTIAAVLQSDIAGLEIMSDGHASTGYRRRVALALAGRALGEAFAQAEQAG